MQTETIIFIILAGVAALLLALFQYLYKSKKSKLNLVLSLLRLITIFAILLLLINPKFEKITYFNEKPNLVVAIDNSESIKYLGHADNANRIIDKLKADTQLNDKFNMSYFAFGNSFKTLDSLNFNEPQTNLASVFNNLSKVYKNTVAPMILITDGNQTYGSDFEFVSNDYQQSIYPIILGDTISYSDLKIEQLNVNKYAYLKNKFPVEIITVYNGSTNVNSELIVTQTGTIVYRQNLSFSKEKNVQTINLTLPASKVGVNAYNARLVPLDNEKNIINNNKPFAVDVIDEKTNVTIVSNMSHPDIGALKKSIESNEQRSVTILSPNEYLNAQDDFQLAILYQPNNMFSSVFETLDQSGSNRFVITGTQTQWSFLNSIQNNYKQEITGQTEDFQASTNYNYATFIIDDLGFESFPPLQSEFGSIVFNNKVDPILYKNINGNFSEEPLMVTFEDEGRHEAVLLGENIWRWRAQSYLENKSFQQFDNFIGKLVQYLSSNKQRRRLNIDYESFYNGNGSIKITAQFFNKSYEFDTKRKLNIVLKETTKDTTTTLPFVLKQNNYEVDLSSFPSADYDFTVYVDNGGVSQSGHLKILDYSVEQQFLNANVTKLEEVATNSLGRSYFIDSSDGIFEDLLNDSRYVTIQKSVKKSVPLIDFKYLLALIALCLAIEWFLRKYNGLI